MKHVVISLFLSLFLFSPAIAQDTMRIDLSDHLFYYKNGGDRVSFKQNRIYKSIHLRLHHEHYGNGILNVSVPEGTTLLINNKVVSVASGDDGFSFLFIKEMTIISLYNLNGLDNIQVEMELLKKGNENQLLLSKRKDNSYSNFLIVASILVFTLYTYAKTRNVDLFYSHFKIRRALTIKTINEAIFKTRVLEESSLLLLWAHSSSIALVFIYLINWGQIETVVGKWFMFNNFAGAIGLWVLLNVIILVALVAKNALIIGFAVVFKLRNFAKIHFFTHLRITLFIYFLLYGTILVLNYQFPDINAFTILLNSTIILMALRVVIIFIKLLREHSLRKVYLFSYLCATEILPYVFLVKITYL